MVDEELSEALWYVLDNIDPDCNHGICLMVGRYLFHHGYTPDTFHGAHLDRMDELMKQWTYHSCSPMYPVPDPCHVKDPSDAFRDLPKWRDAYGEMRVQLVMWLLGELM